MADSNDALLAALDAVVPRSPAEVADIAELRAATVGDVWSRNVPLHVTGSALVTHPPTGRVLLRWHRALGRWLQVGGHADAGERDPWVVARREALEETGLADLAPLGPRRPIQVAIVDVPGGPGGPAHRHADVRYLLATARPQAVVAEDAGSPLRWLALADAAGVVGGDVGLIALLERAAAALSSPIRWSRPG